MSELTVGMDISGFETIVLREIEYWQENDTKPIVQSNSIRFQNHLYGCFAIMEMIGEQHAHVTPSGELIIHDTSQNPIHVSTHFSIIGMEFGFLQNPITTFDSWSNQYRDAWRFIWSYMTTSPSLDVVDSIENTLFTQMNTKGYKYFKEALNGGSLTQETETQAIAILSKKDLKRNDKNTRRQKRTITPIQKYSRPIRKTRRLRRL